MLTEQLDRLRSHLKPEGDLRRAFAQIWPRITASRRDAITREAERYFKLPIPTWTASDMIKNAPAYRQSHRQRRQMLAAFTLGACVHDTDRYDARIFDLAWSICEESVWAVCPGDPLPLRENPYTRESAETAALLAWANCLAAKPISRTSSSLDARIRREITRRISDPISKNMEFPTTDPGVLSPLLISILLSEQDSPRRWGALRRVMYWLEESVSRLYAPAIDTWHENALSLLDALTIACYATGNEVDLRRLLKPFAQVPLFATLGGNWWINPGERSMQTSLSGAAMYRLGRSASCDQLRALGAQMFRMEATAAPSRDTAMTTQVLDAMYEADIERETLRPGAPLSGTPAGGSFAVARCERFTAAMHAGDPDGIHCDTGDFILFYRNRPVFFDLGMGHDATSEHNLPIIDGNGQVRGGKISYLESQIRHDAHYLSANLADAYPPWLEVADWQRTIMLAHDGSEVRLIEMFGFSREKHDVAFTFITPEKPVFDGNRAFLGEVSLGWERGLSAQADALDGAWRITLSFDRPVRSGNATFIIRPVEN